MLAVNVATDLLASCEEENSKHNVEIEVRSDLQFDTK